MLGLQLTELTGGEAELLLPSLSRHGVYPRQNLKLASGWAVPALVRQERKYSSRGRIIKFEWTINRGTPLPAWLDPLMRGLADLLTLPVNWDTYGAPPIEWIVAKQAFQLMSDILDVEDPAPWVVPMSNGGIQLEWHENGSDLEIEIEPEGIAHGYWFHEETEKEVSLEVPKDNERIAAYVAGMRQR